jgi:hypothetical protein
LNAPSKVKSNWFIKIKNKEVSLEIKDARPFNTEIMEIFQKTKQVYV